MQKIQNQGKIFLLLTFPSAQLYRYKNLKNVIIGHLNVSSLRKKLFAVEELMKDEIHVCLISEIKLTTYIRINSLK